MWEAVHIYKSDEGDKEAVLLRSSNVPLN